MELARIKLDDQLLLDGLVHVVASGLRGDFRGHVVFVQAEPGNHRALLAGVEGILDPVDVLALFLDRDHIADAHGIGGDVDKPAVDGDVPVGDELAGVTTRGGEANPVDDVVEPRLQQAEQVETGDAGHLRGPIEVEPELAPGPLTKISMCLRPCSMARRAVASAVIWAAKGVLLREPLKPWLPALPQASTLPWASVSDTTVLLKVDWMCACPTMTCFFSRRRVRTTFFLGMTVTSLPQPSCARRPSCAGRGECGRWFGCADRARGGRAGGAGAIGPDLHQPLDIERDL